MKTKLMVSALIVALVTGIAVAADPVGPKVVIVNQKESGVFKVIYEGVKAGRVNLKISDEAGVILFNETISGVNSFMRPLNFKGMAPGEYTIEVSDAYGKNVQIVNYTNEQPASAVHVSKISGDSRYLLAVENEKEINVRIFDGLNKLVHDKNLVVNGSLGLVYNLKSVVGIPTFEVTDNSGNTKVIRF